MNYLQNKISVIKNYLQEKGLYDIRLLGLIGIGIITLSVFWSGAKIVQQNFELAQKVAAIEQENEVLELENQNKELRNEYLKTEEYAEITARRVFGRAAPGEKVYIVPQDVAIGAISGKAETENSEAVDEKPQYQKNLESWLEIYFN